MLADDPGSSVLTLTSHGMVERSRPPGRDASRVVALWKDPTRGVREIPLEGRQATSDNGGGEDQGASLMLTSDSTVRGER